MRAYCDTCHTTSVVIITVVIVSLLSFSYLHFASLLIIFGKKAATGYQSTSHDQCWEIVYAAQLFKSNNSIDSNSVNKTDDGWKHLYLQFGHKEGALLSIYLSDKSLSMLFNYLL